MPNARKLKLLRRPDLSVMKALVPTAPHGLQGDRRLFADPTIHDVHSLRDVLPIHSSKVSMPVVQHHHKSSEVDLSFPCVKAQG